MKRLFIILTFILILSGCTASGSKSDKIVNKESDKSVTNSNTESVARSNESAVIPSDFVLNEESLKLKALEKTFIDSDYYRKEQMIPLTISKDQKYFVAYKISKENMMDKNELILIGMPRQWVDLYRIDLSEKKAVLMGKTEFVLNHAWSENGNLLSLVSYKSVKILDIAVGKLTEVPIKYETDKIYNSNWGLITVCRYL